MIRSRHLLLALALAMPACVVHGRGSLAVDSTTPVVYQEPPPPRQETVTVRPGYIWIQGRWDWRHGQWAWADGHWERQRAGHHWQPGRWDQRGNSWVWVEGTWQAGAGAPTNVTNAQGGVTVTGGSTTGPIVNDHRTPQPPPPTDTSRAQGGVTVTGGAGVTVSAYPTAAPPPLRVETVTARPVFVWITGRWDWRGGRWDWVAGHWERERANQVWVGGRWELQGKRWVWVEGRWDVRAAPGPKVRDHRH